MTLKISKRRLLIVEGRDEEQFFDAAMKYLGIASVQIMGIGVYIMPDGNSDGMLETLCMWSVRTNREWPCVEAFLACLQSLGIQSRNGAKASAQCWLASKPDPGKRVGEAAQAGYWPWSAESFSPLWQFLRVLSGG
jgi:hypothetical protein